MLHESRRRIDFPFRPGNRWPTEWRLRPTPTVRCVSQHRLSRLSPILLPGLCLIVALQIAIVGELVVGPDIRIIGRRLCQPRQRLLIYEWIRIRARVESIKSGLNYLCRLRDDRVNRLGRRSCGDYRRIVLKDRLVLRQVWRYVLRKIHGAEAGKLPTVVWLAYLRPHWNCCGA